MTAPEHSSLPLRDYDHLPASAVGERIRALNADQLIDLLHYEHAHADRPVVVQLMETRLDELEDGATPSGGTQQAGPEYPPPPSGGPKAGPETAAPPSSAPPHGTPDQPARPKGNRRAP